MRRAMVLCTIIGAVAHVMGTSDAALAGGGCHAPATQADGTGQEAATVRLIDACFKASVTTVDPGTAITFVNDDWTTHNVGGNAWGNFDDMREGDAFTMTFADPGIYPFACTYHPGMTGAIVVGDGTGAGSGSAITVDPVDPASEPAAPVTARAGGVPFGVAAAIGAIALAIGAVTARAVGTRVERPAA